MPNEEQEPEKTREQKGKEQLEELKAKIKKEKSNKIQEAAKMIATREKLERDYEEDLITVSFSSSSETKRSIKAKRPSQEEMMTIMRLSAEAAIYEGKMDPQSLKRMVDIYENLDSLAAKLSVDKTLDEDFWKSKVSFSTLQNFITEVVRTTQTGALSSDEIDSFR